ncbi:hypothetical protein ACQZV8_12820 [Magnetococcales bacterium HHB-1]
MAKIKGMSLKQNSHKNALSKAGLGLLFLWIIFSIVPNTLVWADFDPSNDDTDLFLTNPTVDSQRPNVLIVLDNTANWNQPFVNEKNALRSVVSNLDDSFNIGWMMYPETGNGNDNVDGGYVRFGVRQMTAINRGVLANMINSFDILQDKGNNNTVALAMLEAYRYYAGSFTRSSYGKIKTDYTGNFARNPAAFLGGSPLPANPTSLSRFTSPITDGCQRNFIIVITNGQANENASALSVSENELTTILGSAPTEIPISPSGQQDNWGDEWARYMARNDVNSNIEGIQYVYTYAIEVDRKTTGQGPDMTALMKSIANQGKGRYFSVSSENNGAAIVSALEQIFQEIQAINSVFASTTLPVSVNVRGTNLNQVYIGVFRPDGEKKPRWFGNLKCYQVGYEEATDDLFLVDANGDRADSSTSGFITPNAESFWTKASTFWSYRDDEENSAGGDSDLPDGEVVEKGGAAQQLRTTYATSHVDRKLYTCTGACTTNSALSDSPFKSTNGEITTSDLLIGSTLVSNLTASQTQNATKITDIRSVTSLSTASGGVDISSMDNGAVSQNLSSLNTTISKAITNLDNSAVTKSVTNLTRTGGSTAVATVSNHGYSTGQTVVISGASDAKYNGTQTIQVNDTNTFSYAIANGAAKNPTGTIEATTTSTTVTATIASHGFSNGQTITISGATPDSFNDDYNITRIDADTFSFTTASSLPAPTVNGTASGNSTTATATTAAAHGYNVGDQVTIAGATPTGYNGEVTITSTPLATSFTYSVDSALDAAAGTLTSTRGTTTVTVDTSSNHGYTTGNSITITGVTPADYNGTYTITVIDSDTFTFTTDSVLAAVTSVASASAAQGTSNTARATLEGHGFSTGDEITIAGASPTDYNGTYSITRVDDNTFTYTLASTPTAATGTITAKLATATAFVTLSSHGLSTGDNITVSGASPNGYNGSYTITKITDDLFSYPLGSSMDETATGTITIASASTTATATATAHGFLSDESVTISGAGIAAFNGTFSITKVDDNTFTYTIASSQGDTSGTITASLAGGDGSDERTNLINWVRGQDNNEDENADGSLTDVRASVHGDVLHSKPLVVNYNRFGDDNDIYIFYGANDGIFHAIKGGFSSADGEPDPGQEAWGFIPEEFFSQLKRLRDNTPIIGSANKKGFFADGSISSYIYDENGDGTLDAEAGDKVYIYITMRRGGRMIYALDVSEPNNPKFLWKKTSSDTGFNELGYSWSVPQVVESINASDDPVLIFGAGYDPTVEDVTPGEITEVTSTTVTTTSGASYVRSMGRGFFVINALTGEPLFQAGPGRVDGDAGTHAYLTVSGMDYSMPGDATVIADRSSTISNRAYFSDTGGNVWRLDMADKNVNNWVVTKLAAIGGDAPGGLRKFLYGIDVVYADDYDAVMVGSGDREHPFDSTVAHRMYMFKDQATSIYATDEDSGEQLYPTITEANLYNATSDCIQDETACGAGETPDTAAESLSSLNPYVGWYIELAGGEKVVSGSVTVNGVAFFNTHQPTTATIEDYDCSSDLGIARQYQVYFETAAAVGDRSGDGEINAMDRAEIHPGGGLLPSPVAAVVTINDGADTREVVISGIRVDEPPQISLGQRRRIFWYKEME